MQTLQARRVLAADRRGSSWPILVETEDGIRFTKLRGAAQGTGPLVAEIIVAAIAEALGLDVPQRTLIHLGDSVETLDRNDELADLLAASVGLNLGFAYLDGARVLDANDIETIDVERAAAIVWLDGLVMNPDRVAKNTNLLRWRERLWLIDHGAALGFQYHWSESDEKAPRRTLITREPHLLRARVADIGAFDASLAARVPREVLEQSVAQVPDDFLDPLLAARRISATADSLQRLRATYIAFLSRRLEPPRPFLTESMSNEPRRGRPRWLSRDGR